MRTALIILVPVLLFLGCGKNGQSNSDLGGTGGNGGSGGTGGSGGAGAAGSDMSAATATGCDVAAQTGCGTGQKCIPSFSGNQLVGVCVVDGTVAEGQPCIPSTANNNDVNDNCVAGTICDNDGPGSTNVCRKVCTADSGCGAATQKCGLVYTRKWGLCLPSCTEFSAECGTGNDCSVPFDDIASTQQAPVGFFVCKKTGTGALYGTCNQDSDCSAGLACDYGNNWCAQACDNTHACTQPPATDGGTNSVSCQAYPNLSNGGGFCQ
ncbi:MAG TPA: hypothetical protein VHB97_21660 [Polyangia bacterium]|nr:hypothetical protein [Polyangia bacterium]